MQIRCLKPVIIRNHVEKYKINYRDWDFILRGNKVLTVPSPRKAKIESNDLDMCYYLNKRSGEMVPMYMMVPCCKCLLCQDKKASDWTSRMAAETNDHSSNAWWITLTYNYYGLPKDRSISKKELSNFLKRLRERVSRVLGSDIRLRFVGTGEYGGKYGRPHYHLMLFGMPVMHACQALLQIENAWSTRVTKKKYMSLPSTFRFTRKNKNGDLLYYQRKGFAYVKPAHDNTPMYLSKYMFKPELNTPYGCTPNFNLSSRRMGIGYNYVLEMRNWHRMNPNVTNVRITNKFTGKTSSFGMCHYFKDKIFPTISKVLPPEVKRSLDNMRNLANQFECINLWLQSHDITIHTDVDSMFTEISDKYRFLPPILPFATNDDIYDMRYQFIFEHVDNEYDFSDIEYDQFMKSNLLHHYRLIVKEYNYLMSCQFDTDEFLSTICLREINKSYILRYLRSQPEINVNAEKDTILKYWYARKRKDMN